MINIKLEHRKQLEKLTYADLFCGIGGFHLALDSFYANCVFASDIDKAAQEVYKNNFAIKPAGDITQIDERQIPIHDILCGGFPCQAFSVSGKQKGFDDTRGTLFFDIARIANYHQPKVLLLENVANFEKHDGGNTLQTVLSTLNNIGYNASYKVLNASSFGIPQIRKRIYFVAFRKDLNIQEFNFPQANNSYVKLYDFLEINKNHEELLLKKNNYNMYLEGFDSDDSVLLKKGVSTNTSIRIGTVNKGGQGDRIYHPNGHAITLSAYGGGNGAKTGLYLVDGAIRKLSPRECANIMGFPNSFKLHANRNQCYKQFGNSVVVDVLQHILIAINKALK
jgi:DNA (cytosine-5)-methyltransferase 1